MSCTTVDLDPHDEHSLGLNADVHVSRLAGDGEIAPKATGHNRGGRALVQLFGFFVRDAYQPHAYALLTLEVLERTHHRRNPALHVVGATTDQAVALDAR